jgi:hypothetical protein
VEREPDTLADDEEPDLFGDPDDIPYSIEEELDEHLQEERDDD